nr:hypothetical protein [Trabulsiella odontotermitis]
MNKALAATLVAITLLTGCGPKELTPEQKQEIAALKTELSQTESQISEAKEVARQLSGGLIKNLTAARLEILETNKALLEQRINAIESGAKIDVVVTSLKPDPELASSIKTEIDNLNVQINKARADASQYSGGLVQALKLSTVATQEQSMAMLQQKYLTAKYGLVESKLKAEPENIAKNSSESETPAPHTQPLLPPAEGPFGLETALSQKNIEDMIGTKLKPLEGSVNLYTSEKLPKPNSDFEIYGLLISPKAGLCEIRAIGKNIDTDSYGLALQSKFEDLSNSLTSLYGSPKTADFLLSGSIWKDPQDLDDGIK